LTHISFLKCEYTPFIIVGGGPFTIGKNDPRNDVSFFGLQGGEERI